MAPLNYAKWDHIDSEPDSEPEISSPKPSRAPPASPPSLQSTPVASNNNSHNVSDSGSIKAVIIRCQMDQRINKLPPWDPYAIPADHPVFSQASTPIPTLIEVPLVSQYFDYPHSLENRGANEALEISFSLSKKKLQIVSKTPSNIWYVR